MYVTTIIVLEGQTAVRPLVHIDSCQVITGNDYLAAHEDEAILIVRFRNDTPEELKRIVWRAKYGSGWLEFVDDGTFSQGQQIDRQLLLHHQTKGMWAGNKILWQDYVSPRVPEICAVQKTVSASGSTWSEEQSAPQPFSIPTQPPKDAQSVPATFDNPTHNPIGVVSCRYFLALYRDLGWLAVRFRNLSDRPIDKVTFRGFYGTGGFDVVTEGNFSPGVFIEKDRVTGSVPVNLPWRPFESLDEPASCAVVNARYADGTMWQNPDVSASPLPVPTRAPNELEHSSIHATNTANYLTP